MPISVQCTQCGKNLKVPDTLAGKRGKCPCGNVVNIPMNGAIQATPTMPAMPARQSGYATSSAGKGDGSVTQPETFKKLYMGILASACGLIVSVFLVIVAFVLFVGAVASTAGQSLDAQVKYSQKMQQYQTDVFQWEMNGKKGPKPVEPAMPAAPSGGGGGLVAGVFIPITYLLMFACEIALVVFGSIFLYKAWSLIQDGNPRTSPGKAVGFMFIPFFNIYWQFVAWMGLCEDVNKYAEERGIQTEKTSPGLMMAGLILNLVACAPVGVILCFIALNKLKNACMDIAQAKLA